jgi:hypothetical protein
MLTTVVNFCSNDLRFIERSVAEIQKFSQKIVFVTCDHFFDGTVENYDLLKKVYHSFPEVHFIEYAFLHDRTYSSYHDLKKEDKDWQMFWYATSRYIGYLFGCQDSDFVLFLDIDEIPDGEKMKSWLNSYPIHNYEALRLLSYYYFRDPTLRAVKWPPNALMIQTKAILPSMLFSTWDRVEIFSRIRGEKKSNIVSPDGTPLIHHYSWTRPKKECQKKASTSGHHWEKDWNALIDQEFEKEASSKDFAFGYTYEKAPLFFNPLTGNPPRKQQKTKNLQKVDLYLAKKAEFLWEIS